MDTLRIPVPISSNTLHKTIAAAILDPGMENVLV